MFPSLLRCFESFPQPQFGVLLSLQVSASSHGCEKSQPKQQKMTSHGKKDSIGFTKLPMHKHGFTDQNFCIKIIIILNIIIIICERTYFFHLYISKMI